MQITAKEFDFGRSHSDGLVSEEQLEEFLKDATDLEKHEIYRDMVGHSNGYSTYIKGFGVYMFTWFTGPDQGWNYTYSTPVKIRQLDYEI